MSHIIKFGTDGWRGVVAEDYTFDNVRCCSQGFANYLIEGGKQGQSIVVGHDKRFSGEYFAAAVAAVLAANGFKVWLTDGATPTPVISYAVVDKQATGAVNITASHNPPTDNGFKVRDEFGGAIDPDGLKKIESLIPDDIGDVKRVVLKDALADGSVRMFDASITYIEHLKDLIDLGPIKDTGLTVMVDAMWGNGAGWFTRLLEGGKIKVIEIHNERNPSFPEMKRPEPIHPNVDVGLQAAIDNHANVLLINDGDADKLGVGDEQGKLINQLCVSSMLAYYFLEIQRQYGPIIKTLSNTTMLNKLGKIYGVNVHETPVDFNSVSHEMIIHNGLISCEESGGYAFRGNVPERDGILAGLYMLDFMVRTGKKPTELLKLLFDKVGGEHFYDRIDTPFKGDKQEKIDRIMSANPKTIGGLKVTELVTIDGFQFKLEEGSWLLIRFSGTEPIIRVYCETMHKDKVQAILQDGLKIAGIK